MYYDDLFYLFPELNLTEHSFKKSLEVLWNNVGWSKSSSGGQLNRTCALGRVESWLDNFLVVGLWEKYLTCAGPDLFILFFCVCKMETDSIKFMPVTQELINKWNEWIKWYKLCKALTYKHVTYA